jgi:hypothetical protein
MYNNFENKRINENLPPDWTYWLYGIFSACIYLYLEYKPEWYEKYNKQIPNPSEKVSKGLEKTEA